MAERKAARQAGRPGDAALPALRRHHGAEPRRPGLGRPPHRRRTIRNMTARRSSGRCRRAASTRARIRCRRHVASSTRRPACDSVTLLAEAPGWINYDLPRELVGIGLKGKYRGQTQKWFAFRFEGDESEIRIDPPPGGHDRRVRPMGVEADGRAARADRAVQAQGLRAGGGGVPPSRLTHEPRPDDSHGFQFGGLALGLRCS